MQVFREVSWLLTYSLSMHPISTLLKTCFQGVEKGFIENEWVNELHIEQSGGKLSLDSITLGDKKR